VGQSLCQWIPKFIPSYRILQAAIWAAFLAVCRWAKGLEDCVQITVQLCLVQYK
jgi:hypothetical protein